MSARGFEQSARQEPSAPGENPIVRALLAAEGREWALRRSRCLKSDSEEILRLAPGFGATGVVAPPPGLATDTAGKVQAIAHAVLETEHRIGTRLELVDELVTVRVWAARAIVVFMMVADWRKQSHAIESLKSEALVRGASTVFTDEARVGG